MKLVDGLMLTEIDFQKRSILRLISNLYIVTNEKLCQLYKSFANIYSKTNDEFFLFSDFNGNEAILYSSEGNIFIPQCFTIQEVQLIKTTNNCYKDIPVQIFHNNKTINAFLTKEKIIKTTSKIASCKNNIMTVHLRKSHRVIIKKENSVEIQDDNRFRHIEINLQNVNVTHFNFVHDQKIISNINLVKKFYEVTSRSESVGEFHIKHDEISETKQEIENIISLVNSKASSITTYLAHIGQLAIGAIIIIIIIIIGIKLIRVKKQEAKISLDFKKAKSAIEDHYFRN